ncbi:MAG: 2-oxoacid:acceptor oxidoreductase family protein [Nitrospirae bacterium]|nr:2-oxoacid:acceptor oxidoreductase family protein [Nitrospirota bacterium]
MARRDHYDAESGTRFLNGNEILFKGCLEAGASLITGYPGSPVAEIFSILADQSVLLKKNGIRGAQANNEAQAAAMLNGAQDAGAEAVAFMKSVGLHVAADALAIANYAGTSPDAGAMVVVGDDPALSSTQVGADSRWLFRHLQIPILAPSTFQELKDWIALGLEGSRESGLIAGYWITTPQAEGGATVALHPNRRPHADTRSPRSIDTHRIRLDRRVNIPPNSNRNEEDILRGRRDKLHAWARRRGIDNIVPETQEASFGIVASGACWLYLHEALRSLAIEEKPRLLKLGLLYPMEPTILREFADGLSHIYVVEEKGAFIEAQIRHLLRDRTEVHIWGKQFEFGNGFAEAGGLSSGTIAQALSAEPRIRAMAGSNGKALPTASVQSSPPSGGTLPFDIKGKARVDSWGSAGARAPQGGRPFQGISGRDGNSSSAATGLPPRSPTFCPGCPHRETLSVLKDLGDRRQNPIALTTEHGDEAPFLFHGDIGCYSMAYLPPFRTMHNMSGMGLGGAAGAGADPFVSNPQVVLMGDSTFFHSGLLAISNSIKEKQNITYIILDNKNTAMTGHQGTAASDLNVMGERIPPQEIERIVKSLGPGVDVHRAHSPNREAYRTLLDSLTRRTGTHVVISDKECGITFHHRKRAAQREVIHRHGYLPVEERIQIVPEVCEFCLACTQATACPGLTFVDTDYGTKVAIDKSTCVSDSYCTQIKACPSFEKVVIQRKGPPTLPDPLLRDAPVPLQTFAFPWRMVAAGVGGMGVGLMVQILARAAEKDGFRIHFMEKKGLAIRNGGVEAHLTLDRREQVHSPVVPEGSADLLLGLESLEAARGLRYAGPQSTAVLNTHPMLTVEMLIGDKAVPGDWDRLFASTVKTLLRANLSLLAEEHLGSKLFSNVILLGYAYQLGLLPLREAHLTEALRETFSNEMAEKNRLAFKIGRSAALDGIKTKSLPAPVGLREWVGQRARSIERSFFSRARGWRESQEFRRLIDKTLPRLMLAESDRRKFIRYTADLTEFDGMDAARTFVHTVVRISEKDSADRGWAATRAVIENLFRVLLIKDEVYVAHLLTRPEKYEKDRAALGLGLHDRVRYVHYNRPRFTVFGRDFEFNVNARDWMLRAMRHMRFLRRWLPGWHEREKQFAQWYLDHVVGGFFVGAFPDYDAAVAALRIPEEVRGYREIRYARMDEAFEKARRLQMKKASGI